MDQYNHYLHIRAKEKDSNVYGEWTTLNVPVNDKPDMEINFVVKKSH
jgi:hypothetical protein